MSDTPENLNWRLNMSDTSENMNNRFEAANDCIVYLRIMGTYKKLINNLLYDLKKNCGDSNIQLMDAITATEETLGNYDGLEKKLSALRSTFINNH